MFVYLVHNHFNDRKYVGITSTSIEQRWKSHCYDAFDRKSKYPLHRALRKHGIESFELSVLSEVTSWEIACELEKKFIVDFQSHVSMFGYNQTWGGDGVTAWHHTDDAKAAIQSAHKGTKRSIVTRKRISKSLTGKRTREKHHLFGVGHSKESKKKMSMTRQGMPQPWKRKKVEQLNEKGDVIAVYSSLTEAVTVTKISNIAACCRGKIKSTKGTWWRYVANTRDDRIKLEKDVGLAR